MKRSESGERGGRWGAAPGTVCLVALLFLLFFLIAVVYSSVGFGGGSSYTALLAWQGEDPALIRLLSLSCNLVVVSIGAFASAKAHEVKSALLWPLLATSIPGVWLGARCSLSSVLFFQILGVALLVAGVLLLVKVRVKEERKLSLALLLVLGLGLGVLAGVTGIGGGIYLVPILHLLGAGPSKQVAAVGTWFILVNSTIGLVVLTPSADWSTVGWLPLSVAGGGLLGARLLHGVLDEALVRRCTGGLILLVAARVLFF